MPRSLKKVPYIEYALLKKAIRAKTEPGKQIKTFSRRSTVYPELVGLNIYVHNGKGFIPVHVTDRMVGHKLGEFVATRKFGGHKKGDKKAGAK